MIKHSHRGFTLIELLVVIALLGFVLAASTDTFVGLLRNYKQQSKIAETNIEGLIGLELLRRDIENAGFGLPWGPLTMPTYQEAASGTPFNYNDSPNNPPRPILNGPDGWIDPGSGFGNSDYLVVKATNIASNQASQLWTYMTSAGSRQWVTASGVSETPATSDYVMVLSPGTGNNDARYLLSPVNPGVKLQDIALPTGNDPQPELVFGISPDTAPRMPFNRADYMILGPGQTTDKIPSRCAPNSGVLVKKVLNHANGLNSSVILPLLDCVADMKVIFRIDTDNDGVINIPVDSLAGLSAQVIRNQVKEIRIYILAQEGQLDPGYKSPSPIYVGDASIDNGLGRSYNIGTYVNYRWKLYTIVVRPKNMRQAYEDKG
jgi:prepilin-type N-terminal cleavage/methylation domain-containing protein